MVQWTLEGGCSVRGDRVLILVVSIARIKEEIADKETPVYNTPVLVLNQNFEPLNVCNVKRALVLVLCGKAEVLELNHQVIRTPSLSIHCPSVIRLSYMIRRPRPRARLSRKEIFIRDNYTCQYCGKHTRDLTLDHVIPRSKGGPHTWENLASACPGCNHRKGGKTVAEARMNLARLPREPKSNVYHMVYRYMESGPLDEWLLYLPGMQAAQVSSSNAS